MASFQDALETAEVAVQEGPSLSIFALIKQSGTSSGVIIFLLFVLLFVALYIYFERTLAINTASKIDKNFMNQIKDHITSGKLDAAKAVCAQTDSPVARLTEKRCFSNRKTSRGHQQGNRKRRNARGL